MRAEPLPKTGNERPDQAPLEFCTDLAGLQLQPRISDSFPFTCQLSRGVEAREYTKFTEMWQSACEIQENWQGTKWEKMSHLMHSSFSEGMLTTRKHVEVYLQHMSKSCTTLLQNSNVNRKEV